MICFPKILAKNFWILILKYHDRIVLLVTHITFFQTFFVFVSKKSFFFSLKNDFLLPESVMTKEQICYRDRNLKINFFFQILGPHYKPFYDRNCHKLEYLPSIHHNHNLIFAGKAEKPNIIVEFSKGAPLW
jgi:hypothetical protein